MRDEFGITDVICLEMGWYDSINEWLLGRKPELGELRFECSQAGVRFHEIPCSDIWSPTWEQTKRFLEIVDGCLETGRVVYVHCLKGKDRTGWMCAAFRVLRESWLVDPAVEEWKKMGFNYQLYFWWEKKFREMLGFARG